MTSYLLMFSVGPVVDFIRASRRTRDLHFSSRFVAEMAREAAKALKNTHKDKVELIIPPEITDDNTPVPDRLLVYLDGIEPENAIKIAKDATYKCWQKHIEKVFNKYKKELSINEDIWNAQAGSDLVEFFAAWVPLSNKRYKDEYSQARERVEVLLNCRETLTDFSPNPCSACVDKSSLDGRRESVLIALRDIEKEDKREEIEKNRARAGIKSGEMLDLPGLVKRLDEFFESHFVSTSRIAVDPWVRGAEKNKKRRCLIKKIGNKIEEAQNQPSSKIFSKISETSRAENKIFPYDGQLLMRSRIPSLKKEYLGHESVLDAIAKIFTDEQFKDLKKEPFPYLAVLYCDGDSLGKMVKDKSREDHKRFSTNLSQFARNVETIVNECNNGSLVYAGGDDVLAFVPLDKALDCAQRLYDDMKNETSLTLSVGIAIVHALTPMAGDMVDFAYEALMHAKEKRNSLAIHLHKRSGTPIKVSMEWGKDPNKNPVKRMKFWIESLKQEHLSDRTAFDLELLARDFTDPLTKKPLDWVDKELIEKEVNRLIGKKKIPDNERNKIEERLKEIQTVEDVRNVANEILIARAILSAIKDAEGVD